MLNDKKILAIIPARGGSKTIPKKNIRLLNGKPLISYSIEQAKKSNYIDKLIVSTDDEEIKNIAEEYGAEVQLRPDELAQDDSPTLPVLQYVVKKLEKEGFKSDIIVLLQPTSPFRVEGEVDRAIEKIEKEESADSLISVSKVPDHFSPFWVKKIEDNKILPYLEGDKIEDDKKFTRKQDLPKLYWKNGGIYVIKYKTLIEKDSLFGEICIPHISEAKHIVNIDSESDFTQAEFLMKNENS